MGSNGRVKVILELGALAISEGEGCKLFTYWLSRRGKGRLRLVITSSIARHRAIVLEVWVVWC
jgi:hypothetical protein